MKIRRPRACRLARLSDIGRTHAVLIDVREVEEYRRLIGNATYRQRRFHGVPVTFTESAAVATHLEALEVLLGNDIYDSGDGIGTVDG